MSIVVVTEVCEPISGGNLAAAIPLYIEQRGTVRELGTGPGGQAELGMMIALRSEVFSLGEIIILDEYDREVGGHGRKPSKWDIEVAYCDTIDLAIVRSREVTP